jgi:hypothetical protein
VHQVVRAIRNSHAHLGDSALALFIDLVGNLARWRTRNGSLNRAITVAAWMLFVLGILTLVVLAVKIVV